LDNHDFYANVLLECVFTLFFVYTVCLVIFFLKKNVYIEGNNKDGWNIGILVNLLSYWDITKQLFN
jgi:hypothetical protein